MATKRTYSDACGVARALDSVGERWALMVVRELTLGPKRFTDLRTGLPKLSSDILAQRLRELEAAGVVRKRTLPPPAASQVYELTEHGAALEPVLVALGRWGASCELPEGLSMSFDSHVLHLRTMFEPSLADGADGRFALILDGQPFKAEIADGSFTIVHGEQSDPDVTVTAPAEAMTGLVRGLLGLDHALASGDVSVEGDVELFKRFMTLFPLPDEMPVAA